MIQAILFLPFINSCTPLNDVGYARTCVGESLNERSLSPLLPLSPPPSPVPSTSYYGISIKSLRLMGEPGLWKATLEKRDGRVCARRQHGTDLRWQYCGDEDSEFRERERGDRDISTAKCRRHSGSFEWGKFNYYDYYYYFFLGLFVFCVTLKEIHKNCAAD